MRKDKGEYSIAELREHSSLLSPTFSQALGLWLCDSDDDFLNCLMDKIDDVISRLESSAHLYRDGKEDLISGYIVDNLKTAGFDASAETSINGHVDITVKYFNYSWLGEAKIWSSVGYLEKGFNQLCTRYSTGTKSCSQGGLLVYIKTSNALKVMSQWKSKLDSLDLEQYKRESCSRNNLAFVSTHTHIKSGLPYQVRHIPVVLHFDPKDN